jgi:hypothetical protein
MAALARLSSAPARNFFVFGRQLLLWASDPKEIPLLIEVS